MMMKRKYPFIPNPADPVLSIHLNVVQPLGWPMTPRPPPFYSQTYGSNKPLIIYFFLLLLSPRTVERAEKTSSIFPTHTHKKGKTVA